MPLSFEFLWFRLEQPWFQPREVRRILVQLDENG